MSGPGASAADDERRRAVAARVEIRAGLITSMRGEAARSDGQVGIVLAGAITGLGFALSARLSAIPTGPMAGLWWAGLAAGVAGVVMMGASLCPSIPRRMPVPAAAWHAWHVLAADAAGLLTEVVDHTPVAVAAADAQVAELARVVARKWTRNRVGLVLLGVASVLGCAARIAAAVTS